ncbi:hypothetical protein SAMN04488522_102372 [Pedobacter caeni]|uniref:YhhN-like protein n=2 Tax=Pedobacter caeni TaxID=288992 RepID=A0A1M4ZLA0_9SPHI|nr:hypothetical protein SAMN04488522_102372 [Pedobacter caeni]
MASNLQKFYLYFSMGIVFCPLILALIKVRSYSKELKLITLYLLSIAVIGIYSAYLWKNLQNNLPVLHIYTMIEFTTIMLFYQYIFKDYIAKSRFWILIAVFLIFCLLNATYIQKWTIFNTYPRTLESIIVIGSSLYYYYKITKQSLYIQIEKSPVFWINTAFFIYFSGSFLLFTVSNYILPYSFEFNMMVWQFHAFLSIIKDILIFIGLWQYRKA